MAPHNSDEPTGRPINQRGLCNRQYSIIRAAGQQMDAICSSGFPSNSLSASVVEQGPPDLLWCTESGTLRYCACNFLFLVRFGSGLFLAYLRVTALILHRCCAFDASMRRDSLDKIRNKNVTRNRYGYGWIFRNPHQPRTWPVTRVQRDAN